MLGPRRVGAFATDAAMPLLYSDATDLLKEARRSSRPLQLAGAPTGARQLRLERGSALWSGGAAFAPVTAMSREPEHAARRLAALSG